MYYGRRTLILSAFGAILLGTALHWLYQWFPNAVTALVSPVCESLWEHSKLIYWPYLLAAAWLNWGRPGGIRPWLLTLPVLCGLMLLFGWAYHILLGGEAFWVDLVLYVSLMALGFWLPAQCSGPFPGVRWLLPGILAGVFGLLIGLFTLWPPEGILFVDLSSAPAWVVMPC